MVAEPWKKIGVTAAWMEYAEIAYSFIALFFFIIGTTVIVNTTMMVIYERMREIGTVAAMGMTGAQIVRLFFLEALFISILAAFIGVFLGIGITIPVSHFGIDFSAAMGESTFELPSLFKP